MARRAGALLVTVGMFAGAFVQWFLVWLFAHGVGAAAVGAYSAIFALATPIYVLAGLGLRNLWLTHATAAGLQAYLWLRLVALAAGTIIVLGLAAWLSYSTVLTLAVVALKLADSILDLLYGWFQARRENVRLGLLLTMNPFLSMVLAALVVALTHDVAVAVLASATVSAIFVVIAMGMIRWRDEAPGRVLPSAILRAVPAVTAAQLLMSLLASIPTWAVQHAGTAVEVGRFAGAAYLLVAANLVGATVQTLQLPVFRTRLRESGPAGLTAAVRRGSVTALIIGAPAVALVVVLGGPALRILYGSSAFELDRGQLLCLALAALFTLWAYLMTSGLLVLNAYAAQVRVSLAAVGGAFVAAVLATVLARDAVTIGCLAAIGGAIFRSVSSVVSAHHHAAAHDEPEGTLV